MAKEIVEVASVTAAVMISLDDTRLLMPNPATLSDQEPLTPFVCPKCGGHELNFVGGFAGEGGYQDMQGEYIYCATPSRGVSPICEVEDMDAAYNGFTKSKNLVPWL